MPPTLGVEFNYIYLALTKDTGFIMHSNRGRCITFAKTKIKNVLQKITAYTCLKGEIFFNYIKEKGSYCNFPKLHLVKIYGKVVERHEFGEVSVVKIFEVVNSHKE